MSEPTERKVTCASRVVDDVVAGPPILCHSPGIVCAFPAAASPLKPAPVLATKVETEPTVQETSTLVAAPNASESSDSSNMETAEDDSIGVDSLGLDLLGDDIDDEAATAALIAAGDTPAQAAAKVVRRVPGFRPLHRLHRRRRSRWWIRPPQAAGNFRNGFWQARVPFI